MSFPALLVGCILAFGCAFSMTEGKSKKATASPPPAKKAASPPPAAKPKASPPPKYNPPPPFSYPYNYEIEMRWDGLASNNQGTAEPATTNAPGTVTQFLQNYVVNGGTGGGTDPQVLIFRSQALDFFNTRFGIPLPDDLDNYTSQSSIPVGTDSFIMPALMNSDGQGTAPLFRNRINIRYLANSVVTDGGYWLFVGPSGLPAGGTYNKPLFPGARAGFGAIVINQVCPDLTLITNGICKGEYHAQGWVTLIYQNDVPIYINNHPAWDVPANQFLFGATSAAQMYPIQLTLLPSNWGSGSCSGVFYAIVVNYDWFKVINNLICTFPAKKHYLL